MSTIKNDQISLYCHFNKIIKEPGTSFQSSALSQKYVKNVCHTAYWCLTKFRFDSTWDSKEISISVTSLCSNDYVDFIKTQKSRYLEYETLFFSSNQKNH